MYRLCIKNIFLFCFLYLINLIPAFAQSGDSLVFQKIDENSGLSDNKVQCIYMDKSDFMWIGTASGLNLLDGSGITVFKNIPGDNHSINGNYITAITEDSSGILWIATRMGLNSFDPVLRKFTRITIPEKPDAKRDFIATIAVDPNNNILFGGSSGLYFYTRKTNSVSQIQVPGDNFEKILNNNITHIAFDKNGLLWFSTYNGLWSYNENTHQFIHGISAKNDPNFHGLLTYFIFGHSGDLWIGTWNNGIKKYVPNQRKSNRIMEKLTLALLPAWQKSNKRMTAI